MFESGRNILYFCLTDCRFNMNPWRGILYFDDIRDYRSEDHDVLPSAVPELKHQIPTKTRKHTMIVDLCFLRTNLPFITPSKSSPLTMVLRKRTRRLHELSSPPTTKEL